MFHTTVMKHYFVLSLFTALLLFFLVSCNSNKQVLDTQTQGKENHKAGEHTLKSGQPMEAGDTSTYKTDYGSVKSQRSAADIKAAEDRDKASEPLVRQERIMEFADMISGKYCACKGSSSEVKTCRDKATSELDMVMKDTGMGLTNDEKNLIKSMFDTATQNCK